MGFFKFIKNLFGGKKDECCPPVEQKTPDYPTELKGWQGALPAGTPQATSEAPVEKAEVEKMSERLKDVTTSKPLAKVEPAEEKSVTTVKEIKSKSSKKKKEVTEEVKAEKPKSKRASTKKVKKDN